MILTLENFAVLVFFTLKCFYLSSFSVFLIVDRTGTGLTARGLRLVQIFLTGSPGFAILKLLQRNAMLFVAFSELKAKVCKGFDAKNKS